MPLVVSDTSVLRALFNIRHLDLISKLFDVVYIPPAVARELLAPTRQFQPLDAASIAFLITVTPGNTKAVEGHKRTLDAGEAEAIVLALEMNAEILIDEANGRRVAEKAGLKITGTLGVLLSAKRAKLIPEIKPLLIELRDTHGFFLSEAIMRHALMLGGET